MIDTDKIRATLRTDPAAQKHLAKVIGQLAGKIKLGTEMSSGCGQAWVRLRVKLPDTFPHWIEREEIARDQKSFICSVLDLRWRHHDFEHLFDASDCWQDREAAVADAYYDAIMTAAGEDVRRLHGRVLKLLEKRAEVMDSKQEEARAAYVKAQREAIKAEMRKICKHLGDDAMSEEDILILWREVLVEGVQEET